MRDRDNIFGDRFRQAVAFLGMEEVVTAARSPRQNPYAERLIGSLRRECLDHVIVPDEIHSGYEADAVSATTGKRISWTSADFVRFREGKLVELRSVQDSLTLKASVR